MVQQILNFHLLDCWVDSEWEDTEADHVRNTCAFKQLYVLCGFKASEPDTIDDFMHHR